MIPPFPDNQICRQCPSMMGGPNCPEVLEVQEVPIPERRELKLVKSSVFAIPVPVSKLNQGMRL